MKTTIDSLPSHAVRARRFYYGAKITCSIVFVGTLEECKSFIANSKGTDYYTQHNEVGRWSLKTVTTGSLRPNAMAEAEQKKNEQDWI